MWNPFIRIIFLKKEIISISKHDIQGFIRLRFYNLIYLGAQVQQWDEVLSQFYDCFLGQFGFSPQ